MPSDPMSATVIPELCVDDARAAIAFYQKAFGAKELGTFATPDGKKVMHSALELNGGVVFLCDDFPEMQGGKGRTPSVLGGTNVTVHLNCADVRRAWDVAVKAGAKVVMPLELQFWGDTYGIVVDPFGQRWSMSGAKSAAKPDAKGDDYKAGAEKMFPTSGKKKKAGGGGGAKKKAAPTKRGARKK
jgi:PhnB protein